jgi:hypothetical protein
LFDVENISNFRYLIAFTKSHKNHTRYGTLAAFRRRTVALLFLDQRRNLPTDAAIIARHATNFVYILDRLLSEV